MMRSFSPPPPAVPWPKLMLISCAASGVAENKRTATEAATVMNRTRRPPNASVKSWSDGPANSPSPVRGCHKGRSCCPGSALLPAAAAEPQTWVRSGEASAAAMRRSDEQVRTPAPAAAAPWTVASWIVASWTVAPWTAAPWTAAPWGDAARAERSACATRLRDGSPCRRGFDRHCSDRLQPRRARLQAEQGLAAVRRPALPAAARSPHPAYRDAALHWPRCAAPPVAAAHRWSGAAAPGATRVRRPAPQACRVAGAAAARRRAAAFAAAFRRPAIQGAAGAKWPRPAPAATATSLRSRGAGLRAAVLRSRRPDALPAHRAATPPRAQYWARQR